MIRPRRNKQIVIALWANVALMGALAIVLLTRSDVPVLFYSASYDPAKAEQARELGAVDWLIKGSTEWTELLGKISNIAQPQPDSAIKQSPLS